MGGELDLVPRPADGMPFMADGRAVDYAWRWKGRGDTGTFYPRDMETRHLFYTLRMIWNNFMPEHMRVGKVNLYRFGPTYTRPYLEAAIINIGRELFTRDDITPAWQRELDQMRGWFHRWHQDGGLARISDRPTLDGRAAGAGGAA